MALQGRAALAMWWDMAPDALDEFAHWHAHEHFPERLGIPGFMRASRWVCAQGGEGIFVLYELQSHAVLGSAPYLARLNAPSPWSQRMMPHHRHMVRSQCHVLESVGGCTAQQMLTVRLSPAPGREAALRAALRALGQQWAQQAGGVGLHLLQHQAPAIDQTEEQRIRGLSDQVADWVLLVSGYDAQALNVWAQEMLNEAVLTRMGAAARATQAFYTLAYAAVPEDMAGF